MSSSIGSTPAMSLASPLMCASSPMREGGRETRSVTRRGSMCSTGIFIYDFSIWCCFKTCVMPSA